MADSYNSGLYFNFQRFYWVGEGDPPADPPKGGDPVEEKKFTQKDLDAHINKRFAQSKAEKEQLVAQLEKFKQNTQLSEQEKGELQTQIDGLNKSMLSVKEQAEFEKKQLETKHKTEFEALAKDRDTWKSRFNDSTLKRALTDAAVTAGAEEPSQFVMMFAGSSRLDEEKGSDGKPTGNYLPMIKFQGIDENKKSIMLDLPIGEAFAKMKEMGLHKNLFKHGANPGTGAEGGNNKGGSVEGTSMPKLEDYPTQEGWEKAYSKWKAVHNLDGSVKETK